MTAPAPASRTVGEAALPPALPAWPALLLPFLGILWTVLVSDLAAGLVPDLRQDPAITYRVWSCYVLPLLPLIGLGLTGRRRHLRRMGALAATGLALWLVLTPGTQPLAAVPAACLILVVLAHPHWSRGAILLALGMAAILFAMAWILPSGSDGRGGAGSSWEPRLPGPTLLLVLPVPALLLYADRMGLSGQIGPIAHRLALFFATADVTGTNYSNGVIAALLLAWPWGRPLPVLVLPMIVLELCDVGIAHALWTLLMGEALPMGSGANIFDALPVAALIVLAALPLHLLALKRAMRPLWPGPAGLLALILALGLIPALDAGVALMLLQVLEVSGESLAGAAALLLALLLSALLTLGAAMLIRSAFHLPQEDRQQPSTPRHMAAVFD